MDTHVVEARLRAVSRTMADDEPFQAFVDLWAVIPDCAFVRWCRDQGAITFREGRERFVKVIARDPELARVCHYHIGWLVSPTIALEWVEAVAGNPASAGKMFLDDTTTTAEQDEILIASFSNTETGAPAYADAIKSGRVTRKKTTQQYFNADSEIVRGLVNGDISRGSANLRLD